MKTKVLTLALGLKLALLSSSAFGQVSYTIEADDAGPGLDTRIRDRSGELIVASNVSNAGNFEGTLVQVGYFAGQTLVNPGVPGVYNYDTAFDGGFNVLGSFFSGDTFNGTTDNGPGTLYLGFSVLNTSPNLTFAPFPAAPVVAGDETSDILVAPSSGMFLAVRWYDTVDASGHYNSVTARNFTWITPSDTSTPGPSLIFYDSTDVRLESGEEPSAGFIASIPEPGFGALAGAGLALLMFARRGRRQVA